MKRFDYQSVIGHERICEKLQAAVLRDKVVSAYMFCGPEGIGKKTVVLPFVAALLCQNPVDGKPCLSCPSCRLLGADAHPDVIRIMVPEDKKTIGIDQVREQIVKEAYVRPFSSRRKVFIIEDGETMTDDAQNALLKILEEPPAYVVFLILTKAQNQLLETVRSRCLKLQLLPLPNTRVTDYFMSLSKGEANRKDLAASFSQGNIGRGLTMLCDDKFYALYCETIDTLQDMVQHKAAVVDMHQLLTGHAEELSDVIDFMLLFFRDCLRVAVETGAHLICSDKKNAVKAFSEALSAKGLVRSMEALIRFRERMQSNAGLGAASLELVTRIQEEIHDQGNRSSIQISR